MQELVLTKRQAETLEFLRDFRRRSGYSPTVREVAAGKRCYALRVRGRSMIDEGIFDGDYVVVEEKPAPENGETVVALINGHEATLKKFYRETADGVERIRLQPANPDMRPIIPGPDDRVEIQGRVRGVLRVL